MKLQSWSESQSIFVQNEKYWGSDKPTVDQIVFVPQTDQNTEIASIKAGQVDYIYPQFSDALAAVQGDPNIKLDAGTGGDYEAIYFQQHSGPLADDDFRAALSMSIDRQALFDQIYGPIFTSYGKTGQLLNCGAMVEGKWCPPDNFQNTYDPANAEKTLTDAGWAKNGDGLWAKDGTVPTIRWMVNSGNTRRENAQAYLIPLLKQAGFNVVADNCEADCVFQQRLPSLDYEMAMYIQTAPPDPQYLTPLFTCDQIPSDENGQKGANQSGWCNEEATDALHKADATLDEAARKDLIFTALKLQDTDHVLLPLVTFLKSGVWRTDLVGGDITKDTKNFSGFANRYQWEDLNKDGKIVIGAEQWPSCLNPVTECVNSSWMVWTSVFPLLPAVWDTTSDGDSVTTNLVTGEPVVKVL
jgi:peptide/nickel transport system substrate-binding protein